MKIRLLWSLPVLLAVAGLSQDAWAKKEPGFHFTAENLYKGDLVVPKGETWTRDVAVTGSLVIDGGVEGDCVSLGGPVTVNGTATKDVTAMGGTITVNGSVKGDVTSVGGSVRIAGSVGGDATSMGGNMTLEPTAKVGGDVSVVGGKLRKAEGAQVKGEVTQADLNMAKRLWLPLATRLKYLPDLQERISPVKHVVGFIMFLFFWGGIGLMVALIGLFFPKNLQTAAACVESDFWRAGGTGALIIILTFPAFLVLVVSILGIPLVPLVILLYIAAVFLALAASSLALGRRFCEVRHLPAPTSLVGTGIGFGVLAGFILLGRLFNAAGAIGAFLGFLFYVVGLILFSGSLIVGLGAVALTRFGSRGAPARAAAPAVVVAPAPIAPAS